MVILDGTVLLVRATEHFHEDTNEDQKNGDPLEASHMMVIEDNGSQNSEELSGGGDYAENQRREVSNSVEDEDLSDSSEDGQDNQVLNNGGVVQDELDEAAHLERDVSDSEADDTSPLVQAFHLVPLVGVELLLDVTLSGSEETVTEEGDQDGNDTNEAAFVFTVALLLLTGEVEDDNTSSDDQTADILVLGVLSLESEEDGDDQDRDDLRRLHDGLNGERNVSKSLGSHED